MYRILMALLAITISFQGNAQLEEYNYQDYKQAETRLKQLDITPRFSGRNSYSKSELLSIDNSSSALSLAGTATYLERVNTYRSQDYILIGFGLNPTLNFEKYDNAVTSNTIGVDLNTSVFWTRDIYADYNRFFWGFELDMDQNYDYSRNNREEPNLDLKSSTSVFNFYIDPKIRLGYGRHENITNAWHAYRILQRMNYLEMAPDYSLEEINQFGQFIDELRAMRVFDSRLTYIAHLKLLDDYLKNDLEVEETSAIAFFVELNDMWRYGISENRFKGKKFTLATGPVFGFKSVSEKMDGDKLSESNHDLGGSARIEYEVGKPLSADRQFNYTFGLNSSLIKFNTSDILDNARDETTLEIYPYANAMYGIYPTTRTEYEFFAELGWEYSNRELNAIDDAELSLGSLVLGLSGRMAYWFSPYTRLTATFGATYNRTDYLEGYIDGAKFNAIRINYGVNVIHSIF